MSVLTETGIESETNNNNNCETKVTEQLRGLVEAFAKRGEEVKRRISQPLQTSSPEESNSSDCHRSLFEEEWMQTMDITRVTQLKKSAISELWHKLRNRQLGVFEPQSSIYITWLFIVSLAFGYNAIVIFLRCVFPYETPYNRYTVYDIIFLKLY